MEQGEFIESEIINVGMESQKIMIYSEFIDVVISSMSMKEKDQKSVAKMKKLGVWLQTVGLNMVLLASDSVVERFLNWRGLAQLGAEDPEAVFKAFAEVLIEMRKEFMTTTDRTIDDVLDILT